MAKDYSQYFDDVGSGAQSSNYEQYFDDEPSSNSDVPTGGEIASDLFRNTNRIARTAIGSTADLAQLAEKLRDIPGYILKKLFGVPSPQDVAVKQYEQITGRKISDKLKDMDAGDVAYGLVDQLTGGKLQPQNAQEESEQTVMDWLVPLFLGNPGEGFAQAGKQAAKRGGAALTKAEKGFQNLERASAGKAEEALVQTAKKYGLTPEEATPAVQSQKKQAFWQKIAKKTNRSNRVLGESEDAVGEIYNKMRADGRERGTVRNEYTEKLAKDIDELGDQLSSKHALLPEDKEAVKALRDASLDIYQFGTDADKLIDLYQLTNNRKYFKPGKSSPMQRIKGAIEETMEKIAPDLAEDFRNTNKMYSNVQNLKEKIGFGKKIEGWLTASPFLEFARGLLMHTPKYWAILGGTDVARRLSTRLLTDPKFQGIANKMAEGMHRHSMKLVRSAFTAFKNQLRQSDPELFDEVEWDRIQQES